MQARTQERGRRTAGPGWRGGPRVLAVLGLLLCTAAQAQAQPSVVGQWSEVMPWPGTGTHMALLPTGKFVSWTERDPKEFDLWDPVSNTHSLAAFPGYNAFCAGFSSMADGRLFLAGGHFDTDRGRPNASIYDPVADRWTRLPDMNAGRWYPTTTALPTGEMLVIAGTTTAQRIGENLLPQVWQPTKNAWRDLTNAQRALSTYPWMFVAPNGKVFMAGPDDVGGYLDTSGTGAWDLFAPSIFGKRVAGSAVMYDEGKVLVTGGGLKVPTPTAEVIDLNSPTPAFRSVQPMRQARKQHNTTLLPDGTVLVTGGSSGPGKDDNSSPVLDTELWDPVTERFTSLAPSRVYRGYHANALLLPDGRVLSVGGVRTESAEIFSPPYLFKGARPTVTAAPGSVRYGETFRLATPDAASVSQVTWIRLGAATHTFNQGQRFNRLSFAREAGALRVTAPFRSTLAPPGTYMLFVLNAEGVPSVARMVSVGGPDLAAPAEQRAIALGEGWKYDDSGVDPGASWFLASFDDSRWKTGRGGFGTGTGGTVLQVKEEQPTVYFRKKFVLHGTVAGAQLEVQHDDGVAVWLNGNRVFASRVEGGTQHEAYASAPADGGTVSRAPVPPGALVEGENVIAVQVKRVRPTPEAPRPAVQFDLQLDVSAQGSLESVPLLSLTTPNGGETLVAGSTATLAWTVEGALAEVKLELSADGGGSWQTLGTAPSSTGQFQWRVPALDSTQALVRVTGSGALALADASDAPFTIRREAGAGPGEACGTSSGEQEVDCLTGGLGGPGSAGGCACASDGGLPLAMGVLLLLGSTLRHRRVRAPVRGREGHSC